MSPASPQINLQHVKASWDPEALRLQRTAAKGYKVHSLDDNSRKLVGGIFILNSYGNAATLGFCYETNGKKFGITVAHLADHVDDTNVVVHHGEVGEKLFAFDSDAPQANGKYAQVEIGTIVSIDRPTDSLIFEVRAEIHIHPRVVQVSKGQSATIPEEAISIRPSTNVPSSSQVFTTVVGFGAQRRGTTGRVVSQIGFGEAPKPILEEDLCIQSFDPNGQAQANGQVPLTDNGDCGMIFLDIYAKPWCMHHALFYRGSCREYLSCGVPFNKILESEVHYDFLPHKDITSHQSSPISRSSSQKENYAYSLPGGRDEYEVLNKPLTFKTQTKELRPYCPKIQVISQPLIIKATTVPLSPYSGP